MDGYLQYVIMLVGAVILFVILFDSWLKRRRMKFAKASMPSANFTARKNREMTEPTCTIALPETEEPKEPLVSNEPNLDPMQYYLALSVFAKPNGHFASYDLLQAILATGMQFGDMNIFHYYETTDQKQEKLFSLASATKPGDFQLDKMGDFSCLGLTLFMDLRDVSDPLSAFNTMLKTAEQLAEDLDGEVGVGSRKPFTIELMRQYQQRITSFQANKIV